MKEFRGIEAKDSFRQEYCQMYDGAEFDIELDFEEENSGACQEN